jgi:integrase
VFAWIGGDRPTPPLGVHPLAVGHPPGSGLGPVLADGERMNPHLSPTLAVAAFAFPGPNFSHSFARLCERAGLGHWHPHELRHSGASLMLAQGTPLHVVSEVLGHASIAITKDVYGHLLEGDKRAESMSRALFGG